jgi:hypothetical protein
MWAFKQFLSEGGNVKIGDVAAAPFPISEKIEQVLEPMRMKH